MRAAIESNSTHDEDWFSSIGDSLNLHLLLLVCPHNPTAPLPEAEKGDGGAPARSDRLFERQPLQVWRLIWLSTDFPFDQHIFTSREATYRKGLEGCGTISILLRNPNKTKFFGPCLFPMECGALLRRLPISLSVLSQENDLADDLAASLFATLEGNCLVRLWFLLAPVACIPELDGLEFCAKTCQRFQDRHIHGCGTGT
jgi:hypothetical protein